MHHFEDRLVALPPEVCWDQESFAPEVLECGMEVVVSEGEPKHQDAAAESCGSGNDGSPCRH